MEISLFLTEQYKYCKQTHLSQLVELVTALQPGHSQCCWKDAHGMHEQALTHISQLAETKTASFR